jgi:hypothetical protein
MYRIEYSKHFITGLLAGLSVRCGFNVPDAEHAVESELQLARFTRANPGADAITGSQFWVYNIGSSEVA